MVNEHYEPDAVEDRVITLLRDEHRVNAPLVVDQTDCSRADVNHALRNLATAGWCRKVARGLYEYVEDPRVADDGADAQRADSARESATLAAGGAPAMDVGTVLSDWDPEDADSAKARRAVAEVVGWLAGQDAPQQRAAVLAWAEGREIEGYAASTLWEKVAQPGLAELERAGVVAHRRNVGYEIVEKEAAEG